MKNVTNEKTVRGKNFRFSQFFYLLDNQTKFLLNENVTYKRYLFFQTLV